MSYQSIVRALFVLTTFLTLGCASGTPPVAATDQGSAITVAYRSPFGFGTKRAACDYAVGKARRRATNACSVASLSVDRDSCECSREGSKFGCEVEGAYTCN
jgi:hypothetical protein